MTRSNLISLTYDLWAFCIVVVILALLVVITIVGNALVFHALFRFKRLRSTSNILIGNLALSDFLLALTVFPLSATTDATGHWIFGSNVCDIWLSVDVFYCTASIWGLVAIAFDRFTATTYPVWYRGRQTNRHVIAYIVVVWVLSGFICLPGLLGWGSRKSNANTPVFGITTTENPRSTNTHVYNKNTGCFDCVLYTEPHYVLYSAMGSFIIPLIIMIGLYAKIFVVLRKRGQLLERNRAKRDLQERVHLYSNHIEPEPSHWPPDTIGRTTKQAIGCYLKNNYRTEKRHYSSSTPASSERSKQTEYVENTEQSPRTPKMSSETPFFEMRIDMTSPLKPFNRTGFSKSSSDPSGIIKLAIQKTRHSQSDHQNDYGDIRQESDSGSTGSLPRSPKHLLTLPYCPSEDHNIEISAEDRSTLYWNGEMTDKPWVGTNGTDRPDLLDKKNTTGCTIRQERADYRERRATKRMGLIICIFIFCWIPFTLMYLVRGLCGEHVCPDKPHLRMFVTWLGYANSALNPLLYALFNVQFRHAFLTILRCKNCRLKGGRSERELNSPKQSL